MTRVLIADDHPVVAEGWDRIVRTGGACEVLAALTPIKAFQLYRQAKPDVLVMDLSFGDSKMAGIKLIRRLRRYDRKTPILVFSMHRSPIVARRALEAGSNGFINKDAAPEDIATAFEQVCAGGSYLEHHMATKIALLNCPDHPAGTPGLSPRELEILGLIAEGKSYRDIAQQISVSYKTVTNTSYSIKQKMNAASMPDLIIKAIQYFET